MFTEADPEAGRGAVVVADQARAGAAGPAAVGVPCPGQVGDAATIGPGHVAVDVGVAAVALTHLAGDDRVPAGDACEVGTAGAEAGGEVVGVVGGDLGAGRVGREVS